MAISIRDIPIGLLFAFIIISGMGFFYLDLAYYNNVEVSEDFNETFQDIRTTLQKRESEASAIESNISAQGGFLEKVEQAIGVMDTGISILKSPFKIISDMTGLIGSINKYLGFDEWVTNSLIAIITFGIIFLFLTVIFKERV